MHTIGRCVYTPFILPHIYPHLHITRFYIIHDFSFFTMTDPAN